jgi:hypothetical protein
MDMTKLTKHLRIRLKRAKEIEKTKRHEKDMHYLNTREIFPGEEMTVEEVRFVNHCLSKLRVDLDEGQEEFVLSANQLIFLLRGVMREYNIFVGNGKKFEG